MVLIMGDFNIPDANWIPDEDVLNVLIPSEISRGCATDFIHEILGLGCHQINTIRNFMNRTLDLIFTNDFLNIEIDAPNPITKVDSFHPPVLLTFEVQTQSRAMDTIELYPNFKHADFVGMSNYLADTDFENLFLDKSLDEKIDIFYNVLHRGIHTFVPISKRIPKKVPWMNKRLHQLKNKRNKEWKRYRATGAIEPFELACAEFDAMNIELYNEYVERMESSLKEDPTSFWRYVNGKRNNNIIPMSLFLGERTTTDPEDQAELFAEFFGANYSSSSTTSSPSQPGSTASGASLPPLSLDEHLVFDELSKIEVKKGMGPDGIHPSILKNCSSVLYGPLTTIFNESLASGQFPDIWKRSSVTPIFKKGSRSNIENYRCIAKLPTIGKFFEHLVNVLLTKMVESQITPRQFGFMKHRSTSGNLLEFVTYATSSQLSGARVDVLYTDFSKAFDRVDHNILINKLAKFNLPLNLIHWIRSYLSNRRQFVRYRRAESTDFAVSSGVPQGSHIGPTLFLLFINDIVNIIDDVTLISLFADDIRIARAIKSTDDVASLQRIINRLKQWCDENHLHLNLDKCAILSIYRGWSTTATNYQYGDYSFKIVSEHRDLGVIVDSKLNFNSHIEFITSKASSALGFIKRFGHDIRDINTLKAIYFALVQSNLEYCSIVWSPHYAIHSKKIEGVLKNFTMFALKEYPNQSNNYKISSFACRLNKLKMKSLFRRRINSSILFTYDLIMGFTHCPGVRRMLERNSNQRNLRRIEPFKIINTRLARTQSASITQICKWANHIDANTYMLPSRNLFKLNISKIQDSDFT